ncbi:hypothetical protein NE237_017031 [Protea cynaroides]|uniref:DJ-1/PfpI domain-containing protein n=1 Tax=Protea cynaroides TaxID=273540 RepID=A0A9Q0K787_9MAGN|nr:hypothetical protein NE237_017031 [Protea cynaroides]
MALRNDADRSPVWTHFMLPPCAGTWVLIPVANGSEEIEIVTLVDILRRAKVDVVVVSIEKSVQIVASQGTKIVANKFIKKVVESIYDLIIFLEVIEFKLKNENPVAEGCDKVGVQDLSLRRPKVIYRCIAANLA